MPGKKAAVYELKYFQIFFTLCWNQTYDWNQKSNLNLKFRKEDDESTANRKHSEKPRII